METINDERALRFSQRLANIFDDLRQLRDDVAIPRRVVDCLVPAIESVLDAISAVGVSAGLNEFDTSRA